MRGIVIFVLCIAAVGAAMGGVAAGVKNKKVNIFKTQAGAWLFTIARNAFYSHCRRHRRTVPLEELAQEPSGTVRIEEKVEDGETAFAIHQFLHSMAEPYKEVFTLRVFGELPYEKIGRLFGKSAGWARVTFYRAKVQISEHMEAMEHEGD